MPRAAAGAQRIPSACAGSTPTTGATASTSTRPRTWSASPPAPATRCSGRRRSPRDDGRVNAGRRTPPLRLTAARAVRVGAAARRLGRHRQLRAGARARRRSAASRWWRCGCWRSAPPPRVATAAACAAAGARALALVRRARPSPRWRCGRTAHGGGLRGAAGRTARLGGAHGAGLGRGAQRCAWRSRAAAGAADRRRRARRAVRRPGARRSVGDWHRAGAAAGRASSS